MPPRAIALMNSIRIKWIATQVGIEKLVLKQGKMIGYFVSDQQSDYYQSKRFMSVMNLFKNKVQSVRLKKRNQDRLEIAVDFDNVKSTRRALS
jgi:transcription-repair coupling factor (superfamily II helicase)